METFYTILGIVMIYSIIHFFILQHKKIWEDRSNYEQVVTVFAIISIGVIILSLY